MHYPKDSEICCPSKRRVSPRPAPQTAGMADAPDAAGDAGKEFPEFPGELLSKRWERWAALSPHTHVVAACQPHSPHHHYSLSSEYKRRLKAAEKEKADAAKAAEKVGESTVNQSPAYARQPPPAPGLTRPLRALPAAGNQGSCCPGGREEDGGGGGRDRPHGA